MKSSPGQIENQKSDTIMPMLSPRANWFVTFLLTACQAADAAGPVMLKSIPAPANLNALNSLLDIALQGNIGTVIPGLTMTQTVTMNKHWWLGSTNPYMGRVELSLFRQGITHRAHAEVELLDPIEFALHDMFREQGFPSVLNYGGHSISTRDLLFVSSSYVVASKFYGLPLSKPVPQRVAALAVQLRLRRVNRLTVNHQHVAYNQLLQLHRNLYGNHAGSVDPLIDQLRVTASCQALWSLIGHTGPVLAELEGPLIFDLESMGPPTPTSPSYLPPGYLPEDFDLLLSPWIHPSAMVFPPQDRPISIDVAEAFAKRKRR